MLIPIVFPSAAWAVPQRLVHVIGATAPLPDPVKYLGIVSPVPITRVRGRFILALFRCPDYRRQKLILVTSRRVLVCFLSAIVFAHVPAGFLRFRLCSDTFCPRKAPAGQSQRRRVPCTIRGAVSCQYQSEVEGRFAMSKNKEVLGLLLKSITNRDGEESVRTIQATVKQRVFASMDRELICQIIALQAWHRRALFFVLCPGYIIPYLFRIRESQVD